MSFFKHAICLFFAFVGISNAFALTADQNETVIRPPHVVAVGPSESQILCDADMYDTCRLNAARYCIHSGQGDLAIVVGVGRCELRWNESGYSGYFGTCVFSCVALPKSNYPVILGE